LAALARSVWSYDHRGAGPFGALDRLRKDLGAGGGGRPLAVGNGGRDVGGLGRGKTPAEAGVGDPDIGPRLPHRPAIDDIADRRRPGARTAGRGEFKLIRRAHRRGAGRRGDRDIDRPFRQRRREGR